MVHRFLTEYCNPFFADCKEVFVKNFDFFQKNSERTGAKQQQTPQVRKQRHPNAQNRRAEQEKIKDKRQHNGGKEKQAELSMSGIKGKEQQGGGQQQAEKQVEKRPQTGKGPALGAEPVVKHTEAQSEKSCQQEVQRLRGNGQFHQPNSRASSPPAGASSS